MMVLQLCRRIHLGQWHMAAKDIPLLEARIPNVEMIFNGDIFEEDDD